MVGLLSFRITLDVAMAVDLMIHEGAIWRTGLSSQLPLADYLPSVLHVNCSYQQIAYHLRNHQNIAIFQHFLYCDPRTRLQWHEISYEICWIARKLISKGQITVARQGLLSFSTACVMQRQTCGLHPSFLRSLSAQERSSGAGEGFFSWVGK